MMDSDTGSAPTLVPGLEIGGYLLERVIGRGGMGVVWRARQIALDRSVALKVLSTAVSADSRFRGRFEREARLAASLRHPHIVVVHDARDEQGVLMLAMDLVPGIDLAHALRASGPFPMARAVDLVDQIAGALDAAHARRLVHRDIKPQNVLIARTGRAEHAYLSDFGLAKALNDASADGMSLPGVILGTPEYMAPEQALEQPVDPRTDVYALGCVLFELLSGRPPYERDHRVATLFAHVEEPVPSLRERTTELPEDFDDVVRCALAKAPDSRFASAGELAWAARVAAEGHAKASPRERSAALSMDWEGHVVVLGLGAAGTRIALGLARVGYRVVAVEIDGSNRDIARCREAGIHVFVADAGETDVLRGARVMRARHVVVTCKDDLRNLSIAKLVEDAREAEDPAVLTIFVRLQDLRLQRTLTVEELRRSGPREVRREYFNPYATGTRLLLERHPPFGDSRPPRVCLVGSEGVASNLIVFAAADSQLRRRSEAKLGILVVGPTAERDVRSLLDAYPRLEELCAIEARHASLDPAEFQSGRFLLDADGNCSVTTAYVALNDESAALAAALSLRSHPMCEDLPIVVVVEDDESDGARALWVAKESYARGIEPFGVLSAALKPALLLRGVNEVLARANHQTYLRTQRARGVTDPVSVVPWDELPESLKNSNRRFADAMGAALEAVGYRLLPAGLAEHEPPQLTDTEVEYLAKREHERWIADLMLDGWKPTPGVKDPERKLHPLLVPWGQLSEAERNKDREAVRAIPQVMAQAGLSITRWSAGSAVAG